MFKSVSLNSINYFEYIIIGRASILGMTILLFIYFVIHLMRRIIIYINGYYGTAHK